jgi:hypothetical protein
MKPNPPTEELQRLANIGFKADLERTLDRLPPEWRNGEVPYTEENARWLENYLKLNPGDIASPDHVKVTRHKE